MMISFPCERCGSQLKTKKETLSRSKSNAFFKICTRCITGIEKMDLQNKNPHVPYENCISEKRLISAWRVYRKIYRDRYQTIKTLKRSFWINRLCGRELGVISFAKHLGFERKHAFYRDHLPKRKIQLIELRIGEFLDKLASEISTGHDPKCSKHRQKLAAEIKLGATPYFNLYSLQLKSDPKNHCRCSAP